MAAIINNFRMTFSFLNFGVVAYAVAIGLQAYLFTMLVRRREFRPFTAYTGFITVRSLLMFTLLSQGNGGWYYTAYRIGHTLEFGFLAWILIDICSRWRKWDYADRAIIEGIVVMQVFPVILLSRVSVPQWTMFIPTYAYLVAQSLWIHGLLLRTKEEA